jgi:hypothetical protein
MSGNWGVFNFKGPSVQQSVNLWIGPYFIFESCSCVNSLVTTLGLDLFSVAYFNKFTVLWCPVTSRQLDLRGPPC